MENAKPDTVKTDPLSKLIENAAEAETHENLHYMELAVLASMATAVHRFDELAAAVRNLEFSRADYQGVADILVELIGVGNSPDRVLVEDKLRPRGINAGVLSDIFDAGNSTGYDTAARYVEKLHTLEQYRRADEISRRLQNELRTIRQEGADVETAFSNVIKRLMDLVRQKGIFREHPVVADAAASLLSDLNARRADAREFLGLDCGFPHFNHVFNGLTEGVFVLAGMPGCGKTTLAKQIADQVAQRERTPVLFYSFEQSAEELNIKSLARLSRTDSRKIWKGRTGDAAWSDVEAAHDGYIRSVGPYLTIIEAERTDSMDNIRATALMTKHKAGDKPILLVLDYLQILPAGKDAAGLALRERVDLNSEGQARALDRLTARPARARGLKRVGPAPPLAGDQIPRHRHILDEPSGLRRPDETPYDDRAEGKRRDRIYRRRGYLPVAKQGRIENLFGQRRTG